MSKKTSKIQEFDHFSNISKEWWDPNGKFKILHKITPLRIDYIIKNIKKNIKNMDILDLGCGGGLTCEPLAKLGGSVTGIDFIKENITIAKQHSNRFNLKINYIHDDLDTMVLNKKYDIILMLELIEHINNWEDLILKIKKNLKPKGIIILSTINQNIFSKFFGIFIAENILKWVPKNTHNYDKLIKPKKLEEFLVKNKFKITNKTGMNYNILTREWELNKNLLPINYFCTATLN